VDLATEAVEVAAMMECAGDEQYCTKNSWVNWKVDRFRRGRLGRATRRVDYPAWLRHRIVTIMVRKAARWDRNRRDRRAAWRTFIDKDTCIMWNVDSAVQECRKGEAKIADLTRNDITVIKCSGAVWIGAFGGGLGAFAGGAGCAWSEWWDRYK
jgi:hypothetical protein